ncbi:tripartite tricarboxylate transporter permease [Elioraea sp.]|uniref:tripartite tricarboxylate transporter permease n=1 Tax=Elioraea sp. TaxID=2185103 RepID=UPI0025C4FD74|nr:tripartite tricarboxylate transporter permease [Elioraea sp.]
MELLSNLAFGFGVALTFQNMGACLIGALLGTAIGVLPGIGPVATISLLLPLTFGMPSTTAIIMLAGIYYGAQYGGSTTSILMNLPGEVSSVITALDGYQMARNGEAGPALAVAALGSFFAGSVATLLVAASGPLLTSVALSFGPADYFSLMFLGLIVSAVLSEGSPMKSIGMMVAGVGLGLVGTDVQTGQQRFTFNIPELSDGIGFAPMAMGMFGVAEIIRNLEMPEVRDALKTKITRLWLTKEQFKRVSGPVLRGTALGSIVGILPGGGAALASMGAYTLERRISRNKAMFGKGAIEGVAAPEAANNAAAQTSFIPLLTLGIPANAVMALMVGALIIQGIQPGPRMIEAQPDLFWGLIASMWIGNLMLVVINLPLIGMWVRLLKVPYDLMYPAILVFCAIGVYSLNNNSFDVYVTVVFGFLGYVFSKIGCPPAPMLIGFVLGPMMEEHLRRAMLLSRGDPMVFLQRPISATLLGLALLAVIAMALPSIRRGKDQALAG